MVEESEHGRFLRTVLTKDVHDRLTELAQSYATGMGKWDYGVAIQILLDFYEQHSTVAQINGKLDVLLSSVYSQEQYKDTDEVLKEKQEEPGTEMLGGERIQ
jgi:hypothetical protein